jgi:hypothetical protein
VQALQVGSEFRLALARADVEDPVVLQVADGRRDALTAVERVFIDAEDRRNCPVALARYLLPF